MRQARAELAQQIRSEAARDAARARWSKTSPEDRSASGRKAVEARWAKNKQSVDKQNTPATGTAETRPDESSRD